MNSALSRVDVRDKGECWPWTGRLDRFNYGRLGGELAHRLVYETLVEPIPAGLQLDHLCHSRDLTCAGGTACAHRRCCNPHHLEPVTNTENTLRGVVVRHGGEQCEAGHPWDQFLTRDASGTRRCRVCAAAHARAYRARQRSEVPA